MTIEAADTSALAQLITMTCCNTASADSDDSRLNLEGAAAHLPPQLPWVRGPLPPRPDREAPSQALRLPAAWRASLKVLSPSCSLWTPACSSGLAMNNSSKHVK